MYCCDICGKPMLSEYISVSFTAHAYRQDQVYQTSKWLHGEPVEGYHICDSCGGIVDEVFKHRRKVIEELEDES